MFTTPFVGSPKLSNSRRKLVLEENSTFDIAVYLLSLHHKKTSVVSEFVNKGIIKWRNVKAHSTGLVIINFDEHSNDCH